jgi:hypothetical protein
MALGKIKADTLEHSTAGSLDTQYIVEGAAKAYIQYLQATPVISVSFNISSVTDSQTGDFTINYTNAFASDAHARSLMANSTTFCGSQARGASTDRFETREHDNTTIDTGNYGTITGDLA